MKSWKTSAGGAATIMATIAPVLDGLAKNGMASLATVNWSAVIAGVGTGLALIAARDNNVTSEDVRANKEQGGSLRGVLNIFLAIAVGAVIVMVFSGCAGSIDKHGISFHPVTPPPAAALHLSHRNIGIRIGQNPANQTPEINIGYQSDTYARVPTDTNRVYVAPMRASTGVAGGLTATIDEKLELGDAVNGTNGTLLPRLLGR